MAKSIRSKWRRKCRAVKRERYGKKELERLKKTLGVADDGNKVNLDIAMASVSEIAEVKDAKALDKENQIVDEVEEDENDIVMDIDGKKKIYNSRTYRDQNGAYPVWLHQRKIQKKSKNKRKKVKKSKPRNAKK